MSIWNFIGSIFQPLADLVDNLHTSDEERLELRNAFVKLQSDMSAKLVDYESKLLESRTAVITAEANGQSWLQRSWRPITMLTFLVLVVLDTMGLTHFRLSEQAWTLLQIGLGGYVVGRSVEKSLPHLKDVTSKKKS